MEALLDLNALPFVPCNHRTQRTHRVDLIVVHTNEGPEGVNSAEGLASYLQHADPGYNVVVDENSAVRVAQDDECVWGAGGVNSRAWHICITGYAAQSSAEWHDPASTSAGHIAADLVQQAAAKFGVPVVKVHDTNDGAPRGICGHGDVSAYHSASMGHTDPGPNFPWPEFLAAVGGVFEEDDLNNDQAGQLARAEMQATAAAQTAARIEALFSDGQGRNRLALILQNLTGKDGAVRSRLDRLIKKVGA